VLTGVINMASLKRRGTAEEAEAAAEAAEDEVDKGSLSAAGELAEPLAVTRL
jgi:hypothetical protein